MGHHLCHSVEGRWPHTCITFKKLVLKLYCKIEKQTKVQYERNHIFDPRFGGRNFAGGRQVATPKTDNTENRLRIHRVLTLIELICEARNLTIEWLRERIEHLDIILFPPITQWHSISDVLFTGGRGVSDFCVL